VSPSVLAPAVTQAAALLAVGAVGMTALAATGTGQALSAARPDSGTTSTTARAFGAPTQPRPDVAELGASRQRLSAGAPAPAVPAPVRANGRAERPAAAKPRAATKRWLPSGTGMWIYQWSHSNRGNVRVVLKRAKSVGLTHIFVRTGSSHDGFTGTRLLKAVLPSAAAADVKIIAWDFPELDHPVTDAKRLARAARVVAKGGARIAAVAPDIETPSEGARSSFKRVRTYLNALRRLLPADVAILTTVPWPSSARVGGHYPYAAVAARSDALLPMAYWYNNTPQRVTARSMAFLRHFHRPVMPVGQGYDSRLDVPLLPHNNLRVQVPAFFATAHRLGAPAASIWSWQSAPKATWTALIRARRLFAGR
jgi:hypothetical protein